jgi:hypothetical protein
MSLTEEEKEQALIIKVTELFMRLGIRSLTMDDISRHLGISKKTLYKHASNKNDLVKKCIQLSVTTDQCQLGEINSDNENAIDQMFAINKMMSEKLSNIHPAILFDIQKYHPEAWKVMEDHKACYIHEQVIENLKLGQEQGLYRGNLNGDIVSKIDVALINTMMNPEVFPSGKYTMRDVHREVARYHLKGVASASGMEYIQELFKKTNTDIV